MPKPSRRVALAALLASAAAIAAFVSPARAEVLVNQSFEGVTDGKLPHGPQPVGSLNNWEGDAAGRLGTITVASLTTPTGDNKAARIDNVAHKNTVAPAILVNWTDPASGILRVQYRVMTPIDGPLYAAHFFGGDWNSGAAILIMKDGKFTLQYGEKEARIPVGAYAANEWHTLRYDFDITARMIDVYFDGKKLANRVPWQAAATGINHAAIHADFTHADHRGAPVLYVDDIVVESLGAAAASATAPVAAAAAAVPAAPRKAVPLKATDRPFRYGVCSHLRRYSPADYAKLLDAIERLGVDIVRDGYDWNALERAEGAWTFDKMDKLVNDLAAQGVELQPLLAFSAQWASTGPSNTGNWHDWNNRAPRLEPFKKYAATMVSRYKDRVHLWEIWNEPEIGFWLSSPAEYIELFNATSAVIKQTDPSATVLNGGFSLERRPPNMNFLQEFLRGADTTHWGIWAFHDYMTFGQMIAREKENRLYYQAKGATMPIWINEGGFHTLNRGGEPEQAITLAKKLASAPSMNIGAYIWYDLIDDTNDGNPADDPEHHFGLLRKDFSPKPTFLAYQQVIRELAGLKFARRLNLDDAVPGLWALLYQSSSAQRDHVLVLWREGKGRQTPLWIGATGGAATAVNAIDGAKVPAPELDGGLLVSVSDSPLYVHLRGSLDPAIRCFLALPDKLALLPGRDNPLRVQITNPTARAATFAVSLTADNPAVQCVAQSPEVPLSSGKSTALLSSVRTGVDAASGFITLSLSPGSGAPAVRAQIPYFVAAAVPRLADPAANDIPEGQGLLLKADARDSIVNLYSAEPNPVMHWQGAADLSATARLACTQDALYLHVTATDDKHVQPNRGADIWRSDSIQFAIRTDDSRPEYFEAGLALGDDGKPQGWIYTRPPASSLPLGAIEKPLTYDVRRDGQQTHYIVRIPWKSLGNDAPPTSGFRLNFIINDDDGQGRKGWTQLSDGIGKDKNADLFPLFICN